MNETSKLTFRLAEIVLCLIVFLPDQKILQLLDATRERGVGRRYMYIPAKECYTEYLMVLSIVLRLSSSSET